jgi:hypothetical protein
MVSGWGGPDKFEGFGLFLSSIKLAYPDMPAPATPSPVFGLADPTDFKAQMEAAGFKHVEVDFVAREMEVKDLATFWDVFTSGAPPVQMLIDRVGPEGKARIHDALATVIETRFGSGPIRVTNVATLGSGTVD